MNKQPITFYCLTQTPVEKALPRVLEKAVEAGLRAKIFVKNEERMEELNKALWTYHPQSFLPHGSAKEGQPDLQPIYISAINENENGATVLALPDQDLGEIPAGIEKVLYFYHQAFQPGVANAKAHWAQLKEAGHPLTLWTQTASGWEKGVGV